MPVEIKIKLPEKMIQALDLAAEREGNNTTVNQVIRRAINFYLKRKHGINFREIDSILEAEGGLVGTPNSSGGGGAPA